ncbi:DUF262 domain-containing protein [Microbispora sp. CA-135349]|uniref:DUF262 domain-containing protein n=1 Tax=Microbispora sp. CA-135349 TaxID=3239953 RepID=UPI003D89F372
MIEKVASGAVRVPLFSRPFIWHPRQMTALFESIEDGYPIGSLILWEPADGVESMSEIGGIPIPSPPPGLPISYVLDGHQRLATLFGCLRAPASAQASADAWMWRIYRVLGLRLLHESRYRHWGAVEAPPDWLPLRSVLRTKDFLSYQRVLTGIARGEELEELLYEAYDVIHHIKDYRVPVVRVIGGSLSQATTVFSRLNSSGVSLTADESATVREHTDDSESAQDSG